MRVWRLCVAKWAPSALAGEGARRFGGRWNHRGTPMVYTSTHQSLCALEMLAHFDPDGAPRELVMCAYDVEDGHVVTLETTALPPSWRTFPAPAEVADLGTSWADAMTSMALSVPSVLVPEERNVLLNPRHTAIVTVVTLPPAPFSFDPRLVGKGA